MKRFNLYFTIIALLGVVAMTSCESTEGALYAGDDGKVSFLHKSINVAMEDGTLKIPMGRTSTDGDLSVNVSVDAADPAYKDVFKIQSASFSPGEGKTYANVVYGDYSTIDPSQLAIDRIGMDVDVQLGFPFTLSISEDATSPSNNSTVNVAATSALDFENLGETDVHSSWMGGVVPATLHKAKGANVYKVIAPYEYSNIAFMIASDGETVLFPNQVIDNHPVYGEVTMEVKEAKYIPEEKSVRVEVSGYTVSAGTFGAGVEWFDIP